MDLNLDPNIFPRKFEERDAEAVSNLIIDNLMKVNVHDYSEAAVRQLARLYAPAFLLEYAHNGEMYVADAADEAREVVGTVTLEGDRVRNLFVRVDVHGQGIGKRLMGFVENLARHNGLTCVILQADLSAARFYEKLGYVRVGERFQLIRSARIKMVAMEKNLKD